MKSLNSRGFAISTILYSLLIMVFLIVALMMGIIASNRHNSKNLVTTIEEELNRYSLTTTEFLSSGGSTATAQEYIVPYGKSGWYKIELWGASGADSTAKGGAGAYTSGIIYLEENVTLYFYVGTQGSGNNGGANGGGNGSGSGKGGGGSTDVRLTPGTWNDAESMKTRIMVAAGGGGANGSLAGQNGGTLEAYLYSDATYGKGATQTASGTAGTGASPGSEGIGGNGASNGSGGGSGYYGGGGGGTNGPGGGGSSFISGYAGVDYTSAITNGKYFIDGMMADNANIGSGKAKIELISMNAKDNPPARKNIKLNNVRYIRDCTTGIGSSTDPQWLEIQAILAGNNIAYNATETTRDGSLSTKETLGSFGSNQCKEIDLGSEKNLDEIAVWHVLRDTTNESERILNGHTLEVKGDSNDWQTLIRYSSETAISSPEGTAGIHITAWDPDSTAELQNGTYYIFTALSPNTGAITALNSYQDTNDANAKFNRLVGLNPINGSNLQKWTITKVGSYYKIVERESTQAMQIVDNKGQNNSNINTSSSYDDSYQWTQWEILPLGDGTYRIKPRVQPSANPAEQTYLATTRNNFGATDGSLILSTYQTGSFAQRFYIVNAE